MIWSGACSDKKGISLAFERFKGVANEKTASGDSGVWLMYKSGNRTERRLDMEEIVILKGSSQETDMLVACLRILFSDCDIQICSNQGEDLVNLKKSQYA